MNRINTNVYMFPGQGSQFRGMGKELFSKYSDMIDEASSVLGYCLKELCLFDPDKKLHRTEYTQPALYTVNALHYLDIKERLNSDLDKVVFAGHSLGEYNALFAAGAFDFLTGLKLVKKRGELMSNATEGSMAAVLNIDKDIIKEIIRRNGWENIDIANINSKKQHIISGVSKEIIDSEDAFSDEGGIYVPINVSAAFHSRCMIDVEKEFSEYLNTFELSNLNSAVLSNYTGRYYPESDYSDCLIKQISNPVRWYESISFVLKNSNCKFEELGPGNVLSKLANYIQDEPMSISDINNEPLIKKERTEDDFSEDHEVVFMYGGQGSQYYQMGKDLYDNNATFKKAMNECHQILKFKGMPSFLDDIYKNKQSLEYSNILHSHSALFSFGYSLTKVLKESGLSPTAVLGHSLGEYIAAVVAGVISVEDGIGLVQMQAELLHKKCSPGGILCIFENSEVFFSRNELFDGVSLSGINYNECFFVSGAEYDMQRTINKLNNTSIRSIRLPVKYGFHSSAISEIENEFKQYVSSVSFEKPSIDLYSCSFGDKIIIKDNNDLSDFLWGAVRNEINFNDLVDNKLPENDKTLFVDLSATGTLSNFFKYGFPDRYAHFQTVNQFGKNRESLQNLLKSLKSHGLLQTVETLT